jgi:hypothetical protein
MDVRPAGSITSSSPTLALPGIGLQAQHVEEMLVRWPDVAWFEVRADAYMHDPVGAGEGAFAPRDHRPPRIPMQNKNCSATLHKNARDEFVIQFRRFVTVTSLYPVPTVLHDACWCQQFVPSMYCERGFK